MPLVILVVILLVPGHLLPSLNNKIGARACLTCVRLFLCASIRLRIRQPNFINSIRQASILMKNTSLSVPLGNAKGTRSVPRARRNSGYRAESPNHLLS